MLITSIVVFAVYVSSYICFFILKPRLLGEDKKYEIRSKPDKSYVISGHILIFISFSILFFSIVGPLTTGKSLFFIPIFGYVFGLLSVLNIYLIYLRLEAIANGKLLIRVFIKTKEVKIDEIDNIKLTWGSYRITKNNGKYFFIRDIYRGEGLKEVIAYLNKQIEKRHDSEQD